MDVQSCSEQKIPMDFVYIQPVPSYVITSSLENMDVGIASVKPDQHLPGHIDQPNESDVEDPGGHFSLSPESSADELNDWIDNFLKEGESKGENQEQTDHVEESKPLTLADVIGYSELDYNDDLQLGEDEGHTTTPVKENDEDEDSMNVADEGQIQPKPSQSSIPNLPERIRKEESNNKGKANNRAHTAPPNVHGNNKTDEIDKNAKTVDANSEGHKRPSTASPLVHIKAEGRNEEAFTTTLEKDVDGNSDAIKECDGDANKGESSSAQREQRLSGTSTVSEKIKSMQRHGAEGNNDKAHTTTSADIIEPDAETNTRPRRDSREENLESEDVSDVAPNEGPDSITLPRPPDNGGSEREEPVEPSPETNGTPAPDSHGNNSETEISEGTPSGVPGTIALRDGSPPRPLDNGGANRVKPAKPNTGTRSREDTNGHDDNLGRNNNGANNEASSSQDTSSTRSSINENRSRLLDDLNDKDVERNEPRGKGWIASFLKQYFNILYYLGMSPYKSDGSQPLGLFNYIPFVFVTSIAILEILFVIKYTLVFQDKRSNSIALHYVKLGFFLNTLLFRGCFVYILAFSFPAISSIIEAVATFGGISSRKTEKVVGIVGGTVLISTLISFCIPVLGCVLQLDDDDKSMENVVLLMSFIIARRMLLWSTKNLAKETSRLEDIYMSEISIKTVAMGLSYLSIQVIGYMQENLARDCSIVIACTVYALCNIVEGHLNHARQNPTPENCDRVWKTYKSVRKVTKKINDCFGLYFQLLYFDNLMYCAYVSFNRLMMRQDLEMSYVEVIVVVKIFAFYIIAAKAATINSKFEDWLKETFVPESLYGESSHTSTTESRVSMILQDISTNKIGLGNSFFFIDGTFAWKFASAVGSSFFFFAEAAQKLMEHAG